MTIIVCPLSAVEGVVQTRSPTHVISLLSPGASPPELALPPGRRLHLAFNDIATPSDGLVAPNEAHLISLLAFLETWDRRSALLIHCWAGISRSTAVGYVSACLRGGVGVEVVIAARLREVAPFATPNPLVIALADRLLQRGDAMVRAIKAIGRGSAAGAGQHVEI
ncbi:tyrosine phosphatase family protein [Phenylobacterium sp.]|uniref:tyrosine phosphatase family protein n=1 Tax=Phenylobacterium sp. TaxID=1871053 RepID=UPI003BAB0505